MMMTNGSTSCEYQLDDDDDVDVDVAVDDGELSMDIDSFWSILEESIPEDSRQDVLADHSSSIATCSNSASHVGVNEQPQIYNGSLTFSPSNSLSASDRQTVNFDLSKGVHEPDASSIPFSSGSLSNWVEPVPGHNTPCFANNEVPQDFSSFSQNDTRETNFDRASITGAFGFNVANYNHLLMDKTDIKDEIYCNSVADDCKTSEAPDNLEAPSIDFSGYSHNIYDSDNEFPMPYFPSIYEPSRQNSGLHPMINNNGMLFNVNSESDEHLNQEQTFLQNDTSIKKQPIFAKDEKESKFATCNKMVSSLSTISQQDITYVDDDDPDDICILEDMSDPVVKKHSPVDGKSLVLAQKSLLVAPPVHMGFNNARLKTNDERFIYRVALQDISQPKSEASPPDGALAVPLLRHQRIALSWMVQKETKSMHCFGGILADDQGLGKTISTIALILKERSPSSSVNTIEMKQKKTETLNLDDEEDAVIELDKSKQKPESSSMAISRPAAGTLVVCPTSVLRQWNDELQSKVSSKAKLSVLVYHGGNRTKDPSELAKYDVVLTTYAIVSMEVPKQPLVDEDEDETKRRNDFVGLSSGKKRKYPPSSYKSSKKGKKGIDNELFESLARPLAKVRWFRVVLDEAQSIKNHRTQVARACWGLRSKRRWCLSGTPIQNAIDDLYSYFRFLRYDPYAVYKSFCSTIKVPIQRSPATGYKKLQAVLKTIMLRRTKGTLLDGEPIISLPPKTIKLKKVDFTAEERDFYCRLEADSRAQFAEYAAAGTVKQNYVNILLMLLRLRQACDHPLLVRGCSSTSEWKSSLEKARKLPREKQSRLLNCLEASLAICGICNDPPEDAVVTTCEHVFCNQCILEHLSSDDTHCPSSKCKVLLNPSSIFSKSTLKVSIGDHNTPDCSSSSKPKFLEPSSTNKSVNSSKIAASEALDSSKIKAAIDVLQSISNPPDITINTVLEPSQCNDVKGILVVREKAIVFSQWTRMLDLLEACLKDSSIGYRRLDGTMSVVSRDKAVKDFNTLPEVTVMIMSLKAASLGLNMVAACHVLLLDLWWNPTTEDQAIDRAHRIGQTRPVKVLRLTVKDTVEDRILALQEKKREMVSSAFGEDETGSCQTRLTVDDLKYLFQAS